MTNCLREFCRFYESFENKSLNDLSLIYSNNIEFIDPSHHINGIDNLIAYFSNVMSEVQQCHFHFLQISEVSTNTISNVNLDNQNEAFLIWDMKYSHPKLNKGKTILVHGLSHIRYEDKVSYHRDYFDTANMIYEHIPLIGFAIRKIKQRMVS